MENGYSTRGGQTFSSTEGRFELVGLEKGLRYDIEVLADGWSQPVETEEWIATGPQELEVVLPVRAQYEVRVWDRNGAPARETKVRFVRIGHLGGGLQVETDGSGQAEALLIPGTYRVSALVPSAIRPAPLELEVRAGERQQVELRLR